MASEKNLQELFHDTLKDIYFAEKKILSALPKMAKAAQSEELKSAFQKHESQTEEHVARLEKVFEEIDEKPRGKTCDAIMGIIEEGQEIMRSLRERLPWTQVSWRPLRRSSITKSPAMGHSRHGPRNSA